MKKNIPIYIMCLWAALSLAACTDEADETAWPPGGMPLQLSVVVEDFAGSGAGTRATTENRWVGGEEVTVEDEYNHHRATYIVQADGRLEPKPGSGLAAWDNPYQERAFFATYPSSLIASFTLLTDQSGEGYQKSDHMVACLEKFKAPDASKTLTFRHLSAKVVVHLRAGKGVTDEELLDATVTFMNLKITSRGFNYVDPGNMIRWDLVEDGSFDVIPNEVIPAAEGYVRTVRALLMPQIVRKKFVRIETTGGKTFYYTPGDFEALFYAGKQYEYRLTVTSEGITNSTVEGGTWLPVD